MSAKSRGLTHGNALANQLAGLTPKYKRTKTFDPRVPLPRVDVVSESLCDDVISYLSPTLDKHKGCTVIDLQPGACLFSSKLHDHLNPKWHLLLEPEDHYYAPFIKPLLDKPGSTYRYSQLTIVHQSSYWQEIQRVRQDRTLLPPQLPLEPEDPARSQLNSSTLIIGNLARETQLKTGSHTVPMAPIALYNMAYHALGNRFLHEFGPVRMLFWVPEKYKAQIFSVLPWLRTGLHLSLDMAFHTSEAVSVHSAGSLIQGRIKGYRRRLDSALFSNIASKEIAGNRCKLGLQPPPGRELETLPSALPKDAKSIIPLSPFRLNLRSPEEVQKKIESTRTRIGNMAPTIRSKRVPNATAVASIEYPQVSFAVDEYSSHINSQLSWWRSKLLLDVALIIVHIEANFKAIEEKAGPTEQTVVDALRADILQLNNEFTNLCADASRRTCMAMYALFEDQIAFFLSPRLVNHPERWYEPLRAESSDFYPQQDLALFDFTPRTTEISVPGLASTDECARFCSELITLLFNSRGQSLPQALDKLGVNAAKDLIPMVPAITDARKGGRLDPNLLKVRMVTIEMIEGLVKAFFEWPFRPPSWEVALSAHSSAAVDPTQSGPGDGEQEQDEEGEESDVPR